MKTIKLIQNCGSEMDVPIDAFFNNLNYYLNQLVIIKFPRYFTHNDLLYVNITDIPYDVIHKNTLWFTIEQIDRNFSWDVSNVNWNPTTYKIETLKGGFNSIYKFAIFKDENTIN